MELLDLNNLNLSKIKYYNENVVDYIKFFSIKYDNNFFIFKTPEMYIHKDFDINENYLELSFKGQISSRKIDNFYNNISKIQDKLFNDFSSYLKGNFVFKNCITNRENTFFNTKRHNNSIKMFISQDVIIYTIENKEKIIIKDINLTEILKRNTSIRCLVNCKNIVIKGDDKSININFEISQILIL
jgi:hypothetical protein